MTAIITEEYWLTKTVKRKRFLVTKSGYNVIVIYDYYSENAKK